MAEENTEVQESIVGQAQAVLSDGSWVESLIPFAINVGIALAIYIIGFWIVNRIVSICGKAMSMRNVDEALKNFLLAILNTVLKFVVVLAAIDTLGFPTTSLLAVLGAAGLAVGLALKDSLSNFASGVMLIIFKPFSIGHFVEAAGIAEIMLEVIGADERVLKDPEVVIAVNELADSSVNFVVRPWVNSADYWGVKWDLTENIKAAFDANGISIPFPQQDVHMHQANGQ